MRYQSVTPHLVYTATSRTLITTTWKSHWQRNTILHPYTLWPQLTTAVIKVTFIPLVMYFSRIQLHVGDVRWKQWNYTVSVARHRYTQQWQMYNILHCTTRCTFRQRTLNFKPTATFLQNIYRESEQRN